MIKTKINEGYPIWNVHGGNNNIILKDDIILFPDDTGLGLKDIEDLLPEIETYDKIPDKNTLLINWEIIYTQRKRFRKHKNKRATCPIS